MQGLRERKKPPFFTPITNPSDEAKFSNISMLGKSPRFAFRIPDAADSCCRPARHLLGCAGDFSACGTALWGLCMDNRKATGLEIL
jgi:hypothetical protein